MAVPFMFGSNFEIDTSEGFDSTSGSVSLAPVVGLSDSLFELKADATSAAAYCRRNDPGRLLDQDHITYFTVTVPSATLTALGAGPSKKIIDFGTDWLRLYKDGANWKWETLGGRGPFFWSEATYIYTPGTRVGVQILHHPPVVGSGSYSFWWYVNGAALFSTLRAD